MCELWERGGGPLRLPAARFDSKTLAPQGEAVLQGWASVGVVLETEVWEGRGSPVREAGLQGARTRSQAWSRLRLPGPVLEEGLVIRLSP